MAQYVLKGSAVYNGSSLSLVTHIEKDGVRLTTATLGTAELRQLDGTLVSSLTGVSSAGTYGQFKFPALTVSLATNTMYLVTTQVTDDAATVRSTILYVIVFN